MEYNSILKQDLFEIFFDLILNDKTYINRIIEEYVLGRKYINKFTFNNGLFSIKKTDLNKNLSINTWKYF